MSTTATPTHPWPEGSLIQAGGRKYVIDTYLLNDDDEADGYLLMEPGTVLSAGEVSFEEPMTLLKGPDERLRMPTAKEVLDHIGGEALGGWGDGPVEFSEFDPTELPEDHRGVLIGRGPDGHRIWVEIAVTKVEECDF